MGVAIGIVVVLDILVLLQLTLENALLGQATVKGVEWVSKSVSYRCR